MSQNKNNNKESPVYNKKINLGVISFIPLFTFLITYLGAGFICMALKLPDPFKVLPKECALVLGFTALLFTARKHLTLDERVDVFSSKAGESIVILMAIIFILSGVFSSVAKAVGSDMAVVNFGLTYIPQQYLVAGVFTISAIIALAVGTSNGTVAAIAPIAMGLVQHANLDPAMAMAGVVGGAMFGDNLSVISDTTIAATRGCGAKMSDKFKMNFLIAASAAVITCIIYAIIGKAEVAQEIVAYEYSLIKTLPYIVVLIAAISGMNVIVVLLGGTVIAGIIGMYTGVIGLPEFFRAVADGVLNMSGLVIITLMIRGFSGIAQEFGGIDWLLGKITSRVHDRRSAEYAIAFLCIVADVCVGINTIGVLISIPLAVPIARKYNIAKKRVASLVDIFTAGIQGLLPHSGQILLACTISGLSPFSIISHNYYQIILMICAFITIHFGLMKTKEEKDNISIYA